MLALSGVLDGVRVPAVKSQTFQSKTSQTSSATLRPYSRGGAGNRFSAGILEDLDQTSDVRNEKWYGTKDKIGIADEMIRDPHVRFSMNAIVKPLRAALWDVAPTSDAPLDLEIADYVRWNLFECHKWDQTLRHVLTYLRYGVSFLEWTDDVCAVPVGRFPNHPGKGRGIRITGFHDRPTPTLWRWHQSPTNPSQIVGIEQDIAGGGTESPGYRFIPAERLLRFTHEQEGANYAGLSILRSAYGAWKTKRMFLRLEAIRHERQAVGVPRIRLPENAPDSENDRAEEILLAMRSHHKGYIVLPFGYDFAWETASTEGQSTAISESIERCNRDIAFNVGAGFMLLGLQGKTGSFALASTQEGHYQIALDGEARFIADTFNHGSDGYSPVAHLVRTNYGESVTPPRIVARNLPTRDWLKALPVLHNLTISRNVIPDAKLRSFVREVMQLPREDPASRELVEASIIEEGQDVQEE